METPSYIALSSQSVLRRKMDLIAHNIANANTTAYQGEYLLFQEYVDDTKDRKAGDLRDVSLVQDIASVRDTAAGPLLRTENPLDLAIVGDGFFAIETEDGRRYTRNGSFTLNADGEIVTNHGHIVPMDNGQPARIPPDASLIEISRDGVISARVDGTDVRIGRIQPYRVEDPESLLRGPANLYKLDEEAEILADADSEIVQGSIEQSNVTAMLEMTSMIDVVRTYASVSRMVTSEHERQQRAIRTLAGQSS